MSSVTLGSNIASIRAQRKLNQVSTDVGNLYERLSSGQRINRASDDAAGLAIVSSLTTSKRVFTQGIRNLSDGVSLLNVADGAVEQLSSIVIRLKELAEQSANGIYGLKQRKAIDDESQALSKEYFRIARSTTFNGINLFFGETGEVRLQGGYGTDGGIASGLGGAIGTGTFVSGGTYLTELSGSLACSVGDLNNDGILDLVTAGSVFGIGTATVRLGAGNGTFGGAVSYATETGGSYASSLGDLNGDGILDLVTAGSGSGGRATIRLGVGDGSFGLAVSYSMDSFLSDALSLGDLNGDGILDLVTAGTGSGATIRLGTGNGSFASVISYSMESLGSYAVCLGDLNGDGILDLVTAGNNSGGQASIRLGAGNGTFGNRITYTTESTQSYAVSLGDLNGDGILDLVTAGNGVGGKATVRLGGGNGTFGSAVSYVTESVRSNALSLSDLNGDGFLDLVTAGNDIVAKVTVRLGAGNGTFGSAVSYSEGSGPSNALAVGDLNGDGVLDLAATEGTVPGNVRIRLANTTSGISPLLSFKLTSRADALQALSLFDNKLDQLSQQRGTIGAFQARISVATNVLQATTENHAAAAGRIKDADVATEFANLVRTQILQQAASSVLAQANQQPALALQLLK